MEFEVLERIVWSVRLFLMAVMTEAVFIWQKKYVSIDVLIYSQRLNVTVTPMSPPERYQHDHFFL